MFEPPFITPSTAVDETGRHKAVLNLYLGVFWEQPFALWMSELSFGTKEQALNFAAEHLVHSLRKIFADQPI